MADEGETKDELLEPGFADGQPEEKLGRVGVGWVESLVDGVVGVVELLVDEFAADLMLVGELGNGLSVQGIAGKLLACLRSQQACGCGLTWLGDGGRGTG